jgi:polyisoprenoid-binding protein YceI
MKIIAMFIVSLIAVSAMASEVVNGNEKVFKIDENNSNVHWVGQKISGEHTGVVSIKNGTVSIKGGKIVASEIVIDMNTIADTDLSGEWKEKLEGYLKSDDFFAVEKYPVSIFKIKSVKESDGKNIVEGDLTIKGVTHPISFPVEVNINGNVFKASATVKVDRTLWNIKYGSGKFFTDLGDKMIKDEFVIKFNVVAKCD